MSETENYMRTDRKLPAKNAAVEWISPSGEVVRGKYLGGVVWLPEGSSMYVYYTPEFWKLSPA